ncbi:hypothetical protein [Streptomyces sp. NBC_01361]|uniref:hypothetical protein n=1 Tax=Streptomyces sp. NBC_01361 TaxID=2903838 RepID=UPI002E3435B5|nr:hypothetical protein [Streptomyces sp. NBC_01361]
MPEDPGHRDAGTCSRDGRLFSGSFGLLSGEVLVKAHADAVNPVDVAVRSGAFPLLA